MGAGLPSAARDGSGRTAAAGRLLEVIVQETGMRNSAHGADKFGFKDLAAVHWNLLEAPLYEHAITNREGSLV
jgi:hypothetical protein